MTFDAEFGIGDRVYVAELESFALIRGVYFSTTGTQYEVAYFHNGDRKTAYVFVSEVRRNK